jgi:hypothetical protein
MDARVPVRLEILPSCTYHYIRKYNYVARGMPGNKKVEGLEEGSLLIERSKPNLAKMNGNTIYKLIIYILPNT